MRKRYGSRAPPHHTAVALQYCSMEASQRHSVSPLRVLSGHHKPRCARDVREPGELKEHGCLLILTTDLGKQSSRWWVALAIGFSEVNASLRTVDASVDTAADGSITKIWLRIGHSITKPHFGSEKHV